MEQKSFDDINSTVDHDTLLVYPYFNKGFDKHTDARDYHLGAVISQDVKPIAFYSHKLAKTQTWYTVTEG